MEQLPESTGRKKQSKKKRRGVRIIVLIVALFAVCMAGLFVCVFFGMDQVLFEVVYPEREFVSEVWKESEPIVRACMIKHMLENTDFEGMTIEEVDSLLGKPDKENDYFDSNGRKRTRMEYKLDRGVRSSFWPFGEPWYQFICFKFDQNRHFTGVSENN